MLKLDHIGIAVKNLALAREVYSTLMNVEPYKKETVPEEKVTTLFFKAGDTKIELLESLDQDGPIRKFIEKKGEGIHHIAFEVPDIHKAVQDLKKKGFRFVDENPKKGADRKLIVFLYPKNTHGVLIELCQSLPE